ncbi:ATP-binding protein [Faecalicoccus acidiformans]|uniref:ATP-binding protein n=1 Tax=Faecalicoccus acidiformans TaxID=915173 RepID=UPI0030B8554B
MEYSIIDDFGLMDLDVEKCRYLLQILDARESRKSTIVASQIPVMDWYDMFKESTYADACLDRLLCHVYRLEFKGDSMRDTKS